MNWLIAEVTQVRQSSTTVMWHVLAFHRLLSNIAGHATSGHHEESWQELAQHDFTPCTVSHCVVHIVWPIDMLVAA